MVDGNNFKSDRQRAIKARFASGCVPDRNHHLLPFVRSLDQSLTTILGQTSAPMCSCTTESKNS